MSNNNLTSQGNENSTPTFYVSAIKIKLARESRKTIEFIKLYKNDQTPRDVENVPRAGEEHREVFSPPLSVTLQDHISASISYSTKYRKRVGMSINISLDDDKCMREDKEKRERLYRKKTKNVEVLVTVHQHIPPLVAITTQIIQACSKFRLLIIGNTGVGKSSLINKVFGVQEVKPSSNERGIAHIDQEFISPKNERVVVHDSLGFEAGDEGNMNIVRDFVAERKQKPNATDQLHAIWLCLEIPYAGGRLLETGVENFLKNRKKILGDIPLVVVLTKVDLLDRQLEMDLPENETLENFKSRYMNKHCIKPLREAAGSDVTHVTVCSTQEEYTKSLSELLKATDKNMVDYKVGEAPRVMATIAQRVSVEKIGLLISVGKQKYWNTLLTSAPFLGRTLEECLNVIRTDMIQVWNFNDPNQCLMDDRITKCLLRTDNLEGVAQAEEAPGLYRRLVESEDRVLSILPTVLRIAFPPLKMYEAYQDAKQDVKILMAYIVDLVCLMQIVFLLASGDVVTDETTGIAVNEYEKSRREVHQSVNEFDGALGVHLGGRDYVLDKIEELIWRFSIADSQVQELRQRLRERLASVKV